MFLCQLILPGNGPGFREENKSRDKELIDEKNNSNEQAASDARDRKSYSRISYNLYP
jgi:hypothetical protein